MRRHSAGFRRACTDTTRSTLASSRGKRRSALATTQVNEAKRLAASAAAAVDRSMPRAAISRVCARRPSVSPDPQPSSTTTGGCPSRCNVAARATTASSTATPTPAFKRSVRACTVVRESPASSDFRSWGCSRLTYPLRAMSNEWPPSHTKDRFARCNGAPHPRTVQERGSTTTVGRSRFLASASDRSWSYPICRTTRSNTLPSDRSVLPCRALPSACQERRYRQWPASPSAS